MRAHHFLSYFLIGLIILQACSKNTNVKNNAIETKSPDLPVVLDLMEYHDGRIAAQGLTKTIFSSGYDQLNYGDLKIEYSPQNKNAENNAYCLILTINGDKIQIVLPNVRHQDFKDLMRKEIDDE